MSCHFKWWPSQSHPGLELHFSLDDIKNLNKMRDQRLTITGKAEARSQTVAIKNIPNHTSKTAVTDQGMVLGRQSGFKWMWNMWEHEWTRQNSSTINYPAFFRPLCRTMSLHLFSGWDSVSAFAYKRKHGVPKYLQRERSDLTNVSWAQMALAALTSASINCR